MNEEFDIIIIGGGHAGCEAALAAARMGKKTAMFALNLDCIAHMPCNPNIGGTSKGHLVREIDALGGEMGKNIDKTYIQSKMLNTGKGPAVHSLRAQADKRKYSSEMKKVLENTDNLYIIQTEAVDFKVEAEGKEKKLTGVISETGKIYFCKAAVICSGTYLNARCLCGDNIIQSGPNGMRGSSRLSESLVKFGINMMRFKTGTPARLDGRSVDYSKMEIQEGDSGLTPFSFTNTAKGIARESGQIPCWLTYTNGETHDVIKRNLHRSPMYSGMIEGTGTRYCPSIEDKIVRFADKERHQVFIEPEGEDTNEVYVQGMSTSLPEDTQLEMYRTVRGLENCRVTRSGYAIEYDCIDATQLKTSLEFQGIGGLYSAGQINGSSGYEEAAAQGLIAGINAALSIDGREPLIIDRSDGYIGVLIDDLVTKGTKEPYRMMTSRAEYRLLLRQDNADLRLTEKGYQVGLIHDERYQKFLKKKLSIDKEIERMKSVTVAPTERANEILEGCGSSRIHDGVKLSELLKRPELSYFILRELDTGCMGLSKEVEEKEVEEQAEISIKYEGYINRQSRQISQFKKQEGKKLPLDIDYTKIPNLRTEARQKLTAIRPENIGQASRITGVSPSDIAVILIHLQTQL